MTSPRAREAIWLVFVAVAVTAAYGTVWLAQSRIVSAAGLVWGGAFLALMLAAHLVVRRVLPLADPWLLPAAGLLTGIGSRSARWGAALVTTSTSCPTRRRYSRAIAAETVLEVSDMGRSGGEGGSSSRKGDTARTSTVGSMCVARESARGPICRDRPASVLPRDA